MSVSDNERGNDRRHPPVGPRRPPIPAHQGTLVTGASRVRCADRDASAPCRARWRPPATTSCQPDRRARVAIALDPPPTLVAGTNTLGSPALPENERCPRSSPVLRCLQHHVRTGIRAQCEVGLFRLTFSLENALLPDRVHAAKPKPAAPTTSHQFAPMEDDRRGGTPGERALVPADQASMRWVGAESASTARPCGQAPAQGCPVQPRQALAFTSSFAYSSRAKRGSP